MWIKFRINFVKNFYAKKAKIQKEFFVENIFFGVINILEIKNLSPIVLAFIGDAVHTLFVRENVLFSHAFNPNQYNSYCSKFCSAISQAKVLDEIKNDLTLEECDVVRRARNFKTNNVAKNASLEEYKKSTSFEALIGYLHITNQKERLQEFLTKSIREEQKW